MEPGTKKQWIEALRSGKYQQGPNFLRSENTFCCLGVLLDVAGKGKWQKIDEGIGSHVFIPDNSPEECDAEILPNLERERLSLSTEAQKELTDQNDRNVPFTEIAEFIEDHF